MDASALIKAARSAREFRVPLPGTNGRVVCLRPREAEMTAFRAGIRIEQVLSVIVGWEGVTEADLLGAAVGAADEVPFDVSLAAEFVPDRMEWVAAITGELVARITQHLEARAAAAKN